jgi:hypothetical protein
MSLRQLLQDDVERLRQQLEDVLDAEDGFVIFVDRQRAISYAAGFALSGSQLEQVAADVERVIRSVAGPARRVNRRKEHDRPVDSAAVPAVHRNRRLGGRSVLQLAQKSSSAGSRIA